MPLLSSDELVCTWFLSPECSFTCALGNISMKLRDAVLAEVQNFWRIIWCEIFLKVFLLSAQRIFQSKICDFFLLLSIFLLMALFFSPLVFHSLFLDGRILDGVALIAWVGMLSKFLVISKTSTYYNGINFSWCLSFVQILNFSITDFGINYFSRRNIFLYILNFQNYF